MMKLSEILQTFKTVEALPCLACSNSFFFDLGEELSCTTCGWKTMIYIIREDFEPRSGQTGADITADTELGLARGIAEYEKKYLPAGYGTKAGPVLSPLPGVFQVRMTRLVHCD